VIWEPYTLNPLPPNYRYDRAAAEAVFSRELDQFTTARLSASTEYINIRNVPPGQAQTYRELGDNRTRRKLLLYIERDSRDNIFVPQKGSYSFVGLDYVGGILKGDFSYLKAQFSWSRYKILIGQNILANRIWLGWLDDRFKSGLSARVDRFNIGGSTTIRGYNEKGLGPVFTSEDLAGKPAGGRYLIITNLELRRPLFWRFGGTVFLDAGNTYARIKEITPLSIRFSAGMGLQFFTPIGPIRFDYAMRLKKQFDLGAGLYHLSILYAF
jgi:outer membrane protein assembly factor BamA